MRKNFPTILLVFVFMLGLFLLLYPTLSDCWNSMHQTTAIAHYAEAVSEIDESACEQIWNEAAAYNERLSSRTWSLELKDGDAIADYNSQLDAAGSGMMGYIEIPKINCYLPIYHGTDSATLSRNIGHITGSSLPVGGEGTHTVLSGHRGLTSARLFTDLDQLTVGDMFTLHVLDRTLHYEVDQILIVLPNEISALKITEGEDYCTLVTCTPYGINTHRMLVRGHRVDTGGDAIYVPGDAIQLESSLVAPLVAAPMLLTLLIVLLVTTRRPAAAKRKQRPAQNQADT